jgi:hypothetical protein
MVSRKQNAMSYEDHRSEQLRKDRLRKWAAGLVKRATRPRLAQPPAAKLNEARGRSTSIGRLFRSRPSLVDAMGGIFHQASKVFPSRSADREDPAGSMVLAHAKSQLSARHTSSMHGLLHVRDAAAQQCLIDQAVDAMVDEGVPNLSVVGKRGNGLGYRQSSLLTEDRRAVASSTHEGALVQQSVPSSTRPTGSMHAEKVAQQTECGDSDRCLTPIQLQDLPSPKRTVQLSGPFLDRTRSYLHSHSSVVISRVLHLDSDSDEPDA